MSLKLISLYNFLDSNNFLKEAELLSETFEVWKEVYLNIYETKNSTKTNHLFDKIKSQISELISYGEKIPNLTEQEKNLIKEKMPELLRTANLNENITKSADYKRLLKMLPGIGIFIGAIYTFNNIYNSIKEFQDLLKDSSQFGVEWFTFFDLEAASNTYEQIKNKPNKIPVFYSLVSNIENFLDYVISLIIGSFDLIKNIIFIILDIISFGTFVWLDIGISFVLMLLEMVIEGNVLPKYQEFLYSIENDAALKYSQIYSKYLDLENPDADLKEIPV